MNVNERPRVEGFARQFGRKAAAKFIACGPMSLSALALLAGCRGSSADSVGAALEAGAPGTETHDGSEVAADAGESPGDADVSTDAGQTSQSRCSAPALVWKTGQKTNYTSFPAPGSEECVAYNGCTWAGQFAACDATKTEAWVSAHDIVAVFPGYAALALHDLCLRAGDKTIVVTVYDTCADSDCSGCCTQNRGGADALIDVEKYTDARWGVADGPIEWADLGPTRGSKCD